MVDERFFRTSAMLGEPAMARIAAARVAVFGVGGVGGYVVEVLARSGVGALDLFDPDRVSLSNINRQLVALDSTVGQYKVDVAAARVRDINPSCRVTTHKIFYRVVNADEVDLSAYDYVVDCIDTVTAKMELVRRCTRLGVPIICSMGAGNKMDPTAFTVADITQTRIDPLARVMRKRLRREGILHFKTVYSPEPPFAIGIDNDVEPGEGDAPVSNKPVVPASNAFVPAAAGIVLASQVVKDLAATAG